MTKKKMMRVGNVGRVIRAISGVVLSVVLISTLLSPAAKASSAALAQSYWCSTLSDWQYYEGSCPAQIWWPPNTTCG